ncbi:MAG: ribulose-phosphate 3-epimerase [bacterium]|nr:ribulose-phosphate 3-epimerase [bacterium]
MTIKKIELAPSLLSCDFGHIEKEIQMAVEAGCQYIHWDVMDGHFVPNISLGVPVIASLRKKCNIIFDVHLMIENPQAFIEPFQKAGSDIITFHIETTDNPKQIINDIKSKKIKAGVSINPYTPIESVYEILDSVDLILLMTVNPGFGAQSFIPEVLPKIKTLRNIIESRNLSFLLEVDGGINLQTVTEVLDAGANLIVAGSSIYHSKDPKKTIQQFKEIFEKY